MGPDRAISKERCVGDEEGPSSDPTEPNTFTSVDIDDPKFEQGEHFPEERCKTLAMTLVMCLSGILNTIVLSFVHEYFPATGPLPDITFSIFPHFPEGLIICEIILISSFVFTLVLIAFHRHRWIVFRRLMTIGSILYLVRCAALIMTLLPKADEKFSCLPKFGGNATMPKIFVRGLKYAIGFGLNLEENGDATLCGDYFYSGHTIVLSISALFITEYSPRWLWPLHWLSWLASSVGMALLIISRGHYSIDVAVSYFLCTRIFWSYHTMAAHPTLRVSAENHHRKEFWYPLFLTLEGRVNTSIPYEFDFPLPYCWKAYIRRKFASAIEKIFNR